MKQSPDMTTFDPPASAPASNDIISQSEVERLLAQVESVDPSALGVGPQASDKPAGHELIRRHEFPKVSLYSPAQLRQLRMRHEDYIGSLAARLSIRMGLDLGLQMSKLEAVSFHSFTNGLSNPTYLSLLKLHPLPGIGLLDIPPRLGLCMVDRELGGSGRTPDETLQIGKIEARLLSKVVDLIVQEWCGAWHDILEIRPTVLGTESNSRFLTTSGPSDIMLVIGVEMHFGDTVDAMQLAFPSPMLEPLTLKLNSAANAGQKQGAAVPPPLPQWNPHFDDIQVRLQAELPEIQLPAGQVAALKPGDVLNIPAELMTRVRLRLADHPGFVGTLGMSNQRRAVRIEEPATLPGRT
jgi:flagellar motor switch protein FliM